MTIAAVPRPGAFPFHGENIATTLPTVSEGAGYVASTVANSKTANAIGKSAGRWLQQIDLVSLQVSDLIESNAAILVSGALEYTVGASIANAVPSQTPTVIGGGGRYAWDEYVLSIGGANPATFAASSRTWIYGSTATLAPGAYPSVRIETVPLATPAAPGVGEVVLGGVDTGPALITANLGSSLTTIVPIGPVVSSTGTGTRVEIVGGDLPAGDAALAVDGQDGRGALVVSISATDAAITGENTSGGAAISSIGPLLGSSTITAPELISSGNALGNPSATIAASPGAPSVQVTGSGSTVAGEAAILIAGGAGRAIEAAVSGTVPGVTVTNTSSGAGLSVTGSGSGSCASLSATSTGTCITATSTGSGNAITATGGTGTSRALNALATATGADAVAASTAGGATAAAAAVRATAAGDAAALVATATNGYAATLQSDTTSPITAPLRLVPQNADPSTPAQGDLAFNSARGAGGKLRARMLAQHESVHSSARGYVWAFGSAASGGPIAGGSGNLSLAQITPEQTGDVLVTCTGTLEYSADNASCTVTVVDVTSGVTLATGVERGIDTDGVAPNTRSFAIRGIRTLPDTVTRTFACVITANTGTITYSNVICSVEGVQ